MGKLFKNQLENYQSKRHQKEIQESGISGYCTCCGAPNYVKAGQKHDEECIWYSECQEAKTL